MKTVEPIRDQKQICAVKNYLKERNLRDYAMFVVGINIALRISDLLSLTWQDVATGTIDIEEGKTKKPRTIKLNKAALKALQELQDSLDNPTGHIFASREGGPITRQQANSILKNAAKAVGIKENIGTHSLRKTWGYHAWKKGFNPALIMETLNHSNLSVTKRYLGIRQDEINGLYESLVI